MLLPIRIPSRNGVKDYGIHHAAISPIFVLWCLLALSFVGELRTLAAQTLEVELNQGKVYGTAQHAHDNYPFFAFFAVPYALPPVGDERFQEPEDHPGWADEMPRDYKEPAPPCPQWDFEADKFIGEEDCLYLNIFTSKNPEKVNSASGSPLPVMVVLQGYGYSTANLHLRPDFLIREEIIVVTLNYRLGVLGFFSTEDDHAPGNYGLLDVIQALRWLKHNVDQFGGDPTRVTVMGHSAGAAIVSLLMVSPHSSGLFWAAIAHSGSALTDWGLQENPMAPADRLAQALKCPDPEYHPDKTVECLRDRTAHQIVDAHRKFMRFAYLPVEFAPVVDVEWREEDPVLPKHPKKMIEEGKSSHIPLLVGVTTDEGLTMYQMIRLQKIEEKIFTNATLATRGFLPDLLDSLTNEDVDGHALAEAAIDSYFRDVRFDNARQVAPALTELLGDALVYGAVDTLVRLHSVHAQTFTFILETRPYGPETSPSFHMTQSLQSRIPEGSFIQTGVGHGDDLPLLFRLGTIPPQPYLPITAAVRRLWCNFVKHRNPTLPSTNIPSGVPTWDPYSSQNHFVYRITSHLVAGRGLYRTREAGFWRQMKEAAVPVEEPPAVYIYDHAGHAAHTTALAMITAIAGGLMFIIFGLVALLTSRRCFPPAQSSEPAAPEAGASGVDDEPEATSV